MKIIEQQYFSTEELADLLRLKKNTIERWRTNRNCPFQWIKIGGRILYDRAEVLAYLDSQKRDQINRLQTKGVNHANII